MMKKVAIIQARMGSTRLPGKVLMKLNNKTMLEYIVERLKMSRLIDEIVIATSDEEMDCAIVEVAKNLGIGYFVGSEDDVLDRYLKAAKKVRADIVVRISADNPLTDPFIIDKLIEDHIRHSSDYTFMNNLPIGISGEVFSLNSLEKSSQLGKKPNHREHINEFILENPEHFKVRLLNPPEGLKRPQYRLTVDTKKDFEFMELIYEKFYRKKKIIKLEDVINFLDSNHSITSGYRYERIIKY